MGIDFQSDKNRFTYTTRIADNSWKEVIKDLVPIPKISKALEIGCGGGIYLKALSDMGIPSVTGLDFSNAILDGAKENCKDYNTIYLDYGNALDTGLEDNRFELLLERALIHHIEDLKACFKEAYRLLEDDGILIIQDRTPDDCLIKGSSNHIRGYFFELFPRLIEKETNRRHNSQQVIQILKEVGFKEVEEIKFWEVRNVYKNKEQLLTDLGERIGRSILHELDDKELQLLINHIDHSIFIEENIVEKDRWTIWKAIK